MYGENPLSHMREAPVNLLGKRGDLFIHGGHIAFSGANCLQNHGRGGGDFVYADTDSVVDRVENGGGDGDGCNFRNTLGT